MQLCLQHYLIFLLPFPSMKIEPQPAEKKLPVVIQNTMPAAGRYVWFSGQCFLCLKVHKTVLTAYPRTVPQSWAIQKGDWVWSKVQAAGQSWGSSRTDSTALHTLTAWQGSVKPQNPVPSSVPPQPPCWILLLGECRAGKAFLGDTLLLQTGI